MGKGLILFFMPQRKNVAEKPLFSPKFQERKHGCFNMVLSFKYTTIKHRDGTISKVPLIPITILGKERVFANALVDSGSDMCAISKFTAKVLGLPITRQQETAFGIGGKVESCQSEMLITFGRESEKYIFRTTVKVILSDEDIPIILGQESFFDKFIISFNKRENTFSLKKT